MRSLVLTVGHILNPQIKWIDRMHTLSQCLEGMSSILVSPLELGCRKYIGRKFWLRSQRKKTSGCCVCPFLIDARVCEYLHCFTEMPLSSLTLCQPREGRLVLGVSNTAAKGCLEWKPFNLRAHCELSASYLPLAFLHSRPLATEPCEVDCLCSTKGQVQKLSSHLGNGPGWSRMDGLLQICKKTITYKQNN